MGRTAEKPFSFHWTKFGLNRSIRISPQASGARK